MKIIELNEISKYIKDNMTIMVGGFLGVGTPEKIIDFLLENGCKNLTLICNDTSFPDKGVGKLIVSKQIKKAIVSHIGTNPETGRQMLANELDVELVPQGSLAEKVRCGGSGLGGVLTPTGVGTAVQTDENTIVVDGKIYLLEKPLKADISFIYATKSDEKGNLLCEATTKNFNTLMSMASEVVIAEVDEIVKVGQIDSDSVSVPHILVDYVIKGGI